MPKKIKKRSKKRDEDEEILDESGQVDQDGPDVLPAEGQEDFGEMVVDIPEHERDAFQMASARAASWIEDNRPVAIGVFAAVLLIPFAIYGAVYFSGQQEAKASAEVSEALVTYSRPVEGSASMQLFEQNDKLDKPETVFETNEARWQAVYDQANEALSAQGKGDLGVAARYSKAGAAYQLGKYDEAVSLYEEVLADKRGASLHLFATLSLAMSQAGQGETEKAAATFDKLGAMNEEYLGLALYHKGRVFEASGDVEQAKEVYHELLEEQPDSSYKNDVERRLATL